MNSMRVWWYVWRLGHRSADVRKAAAKALGELGDPRAVGPLINALGDRDSIVCHAAARALGALGDRLAVDPLISALGNESCSVRVAAAESLWELGETDWRQWIRGDMGDWGRLVQSRHPRAIEPLIAALGRANRGNPWVQPAVLAEAMGKLGDPRAIEPLINALDINDFDVREAAAEALERLAAVDPLITALCHDSWFVRKAASEALGKLGNPRAVAPLIAALDDQSFDVRESAVEALGRLGDPRAVEPLIKSLGDGEYGVRKAAAEALALVAGKSPGRWQEIERKAAAMHGDHTEDSHDFSHQDSPLKQHFSWYTNSVGTWVEQTMPQFPIPGGGRPTEHALDREVEGQVSDVVQCAVFAPPHIPAAGTFLLQVFAHLGEQAEQVTKAANEFDETAKRLAVSTLWTEIERGDRLSFQLSVQGLQVDEPLQHLIWRGRAESVQFGVTVPEICDPGVVIGTVHVMRQSVPVGHVKFRLEIVARGGVAAESEHLGAEAKRYRQAFTSYASADRAEVLRRVGILPHCGLHYFVDVMNLDPGARWEHALYRHIDECDVFFLFWSAAASESPWVRKEYLYALQRQHGDPLFPPEICPVPIEGPPPVSPPEELKHLHFEDPALYFILDPCQRTNGPDIGVGFPAPLPGDDF